MSATSATKKATIEYCADDDHAWKIDGVKFASKEITLQPRYLWSYNSGGSYSARARIFSFLVEYHGQPTIELVPAIRRSDSRPGMYNKVTGTFLTNSGTGEFLAGPEVRANAKAGAKLPFQYQEVEYIEGTGTQYMSQFTLNKAYTGDLTVGYKFTVTEHTDAMYFSTITSNMSAGQAYSLGYTMSGSSLYIRWNQVADSSTAIAYTSPEICEVSRTNAIENVTLGYVSLFCHGVDYKPWKGKLYKYWLKIDDSYIFNFVPCYRKADNEIGLYDLVGRQFYANSGTGTFIKGPDVAYADEIVVVDYLEGLGSQYIDTGIKTLKAPFRMEFEFRRNED